MSASVSEKKEKQASERRLEIVSVGDCVVDCLFYVDRMPKIGETMTANNFCDSPGGKGANGSIASARLGSRSALICKLGNDMFGRNFLGILEKDHINIEHVTFTDKAPTSVASIMVFEDGRNAIAVNFGATLELRENDIENAENMIKQAKILITTMVVRPETALHALRVAKRNGLMTIFNFAPATTDLSAEFNKYVDLLIVNQVEAEVFTGTTVRNEQDAEKAAREVISRDGFEIGVIVTMGESGCLFGDKKSQTVRMFEAKKVQVVDSTGAGDAFVGSLAHYLAVLGVESIHRAIELATEYASLSVQRKGTQASYPFLNDLDVKFRV